MEDQESANGKVGSHLQYFLLSRADQALPKPESSSLCKPFSTDGAMVASACAGGRILISKAVDGTFLYELLHGAGAVKSVAWIRRTPTERQLIAAYAKGDVVTWSMAQTLSPQKQILKDFNREISMLVYDIASQNLLISLGNALALHPVQTHLMSTQDLFYECSSTVRGIGFLSAGTMCAASVCSKRTILLLNVIGGLLSLQTSIYVEYKPHSIAASSDSSTFAVAGLDGSVHIYNWYSHAPIQERAVVEYTRAFIRPRPITMTFVHGSQFLFMGGEVEEAVMVDLMNPTKRSVFKHEKGCYVAAVAAWSNSEVVRLLTGSSHGRNYVMQWQCGVSDLLPTDCSVFGTTADHVAFSRKLLCKHRRDRSTARPMRGAILFAL
ncbi:hypothetical protein FRC17_000400, partial [Serendipita sp. 399]